MNRVCFICKKPMTEEEYQNCRACPDCQKSRIPMIKATEENRPETAENIRGYNIGESDYSKHKIQPWDIWIEYKLNPFDADIVKRVLRHKKTDSRKMDYEKIIHICKERIRQIETGNDPWEA